MAFSSPIRARTRRDRPDELRQGEDRRSARNPKMSGDNVNKPDRALLASALCQR
nr:hypothetical protein CDS [Bradyrhizobium sp.]